MITDSSTRPLVQNAYVQTNRSYRISSLEFSNISCSTKTHLIQIQILVIKHTSSGSFLKKIYITIGHVPK